MGTESFAASTGRHRSYLLASGSNGSAQLGLGHVEDVSLFEKCRFAPRKRNPSPSGVKSVDRSEGQTKETKDEDHDPLQDSETEILSLTSGSSHSLLLLQVPSASTGRSASSVASSIQPITENHSVTHLYATGSNEHFQLGPLFSSRIETTRWTRVCVRELLKSAGVDLKGAEVEGEAQDEKEIEEKEKRGAASEIDKEGALRGRIRYAVKQIACTWTTSFVLLSRKRLPPLNSKTTTSPPSSRNLKMSDLLLSFGSNDHSELGIGLHLDEEVEKERASWERKVWVVDFPSTLEKAKGLGKGMKKEKKRSGDRDGRKHETESQTMRGVEEMERLEIDLLKGGQRNVLCVGKYYRSSTRTRPTLPNGPYPHADSPVDVFASEGKDLEEEAFFVGEALFGWGASRHGQLSERSRCILDVVENRGSGSAQTEVEDLVEKGVEAQDPSPGSRRIGIENPASEKLALPSSAASGSCSSSSAKRLVKGKTSSAPLIKPKGRTRPQVFSAKTGVEILPFKKKMGLYPETVGSPLCIPLPPLCDDMNSSGSDTGSNFPEIGRMTAKVKDLAMGSSHTLVLLSDGRIVSFGSKNKDQIPLSFPLAAEKHQHIVKGIGSTWNTSFVQTSRDTGEDELWVCGSGHRGQHGNGENDGDEGVVRGKEAGLLNQVQLSAGRRIVGVAYGSEHVICVSEPATASCPEAASLASGENQNKGMGDLQKEVYVWGWNEHGNLGVGDKIDRWIPVEVDVVSLLKGVVDQQVQRVMIEKAWAGCGTSWIWVSVSE